MRDESEEKPSQDEDSEVEAPEEEEADLECDTSEEDEPQNEVGKAARERSPADDLRVLESVLQRTGTELRMPVFFEGALWYGVTVVAVLLSGLLLAAGVSEFGYAIARWVMLIGTTSATIGGIAALTLFLVRRPTTEQIAARIQRHSTEFRSDLVAALEFGRALQEDGGETLRDSGYSETMAREHLGRTVRRVHEAGEKHSLAHLVPSRDLTPPILAFAGSVALILIPLFLDPGWTLGVVTGERAGTPVVGERVVEDTIVGRINGIFVYPGYTSLDRQMSDLGTGYIESLEGTEVHLRASLMKSDWQSVEMVVEVGEEEPQVVEMNLGDGWRASARIVLSEDGHYWFRGRTMEGRPVEDRMKRRIRVRSDDAPEVNVISHEGRVEVQPDDVVEFEFEVIDDFGVDSVRRVYHFQGSEDDAEQDRLDLPELSDQPTTIDGTSTLDLGPLNLQPKDAIVVYFESRDNNTATGPGLGESNQVLLYVESPEDKHMRNIAEQQEAMEALLGHLADFLEAPVGERRLHDGGAYRQHVEPMLEEAERIERYQQTRTIHQHREPILEAMNEIVEVLEEDPLMVSRNLTLFKGLVSELEQLSKDGDDLFARLDRRANRRDLTVAHVQEVADYAARAEEELEKGILSLEDLLVSQKMDLVEATADEIDELRDRLRELLEEYRDTEDPELKEAIQREIQRLRQRMSELMQRMQMQMREMPQEHVNLEAMEQMEMQNRAEDLNDSMRSIEEMIDADDIDGALEALEQMDSALDQLTGEMSDSFSEMQPQGLSELDQAVAEMMDEVTQLQEMEQSIEERTRDLQEALREERQEKLDEMLDPVVNELLEEVRAQREAMERMEDRDLSAQDRAGADRAEESVERLQEMVEQKDMEQARESARQASRDLQSMRSTMNLSKRYVEQDSQQGEDLQEAIGDANEVVERGEDIEERINEFMEQAQQDLQPGEEQRFDELAEEQGEARQRAEQLRQQIEEQSEQYPALEQELRPSMEGAEQAMGEAQKRLGERGMQQALDEERSALEHLGQLGESMGDALQQQRQQDREESGQSQAQDDEVEIPGEDSGEMRERMRHEMMEGMREGRAEDYESQIERYFRSLVE